jgi:hypothetical protein
MDTVNIEAVDALMAAITTLLPTPADPTLPPTLRLHSLRTTPTGLGGFVALHPDPLGEVVGRRLAAAIRVTVTANTVNELNTAVTTLSRSLLGASRVTLQSVGILRLALTEVAARSGGAPAGSQVQQDLGIDVLYEFLKRPTTAGETIQQIPINLHPG